MSLWGYDLLSIGRGARLLEEVVLREDTETSLGTSVSFLRWLYAPLKHSLFAIVMHHSEKPP